MKLTRKLRGSKCFKENLWRGKKEAQGVPLPTLLQIRKKMMDQHPLLMPSWTNRTPWNHSVICKVKSKALSLRKFKSRMSNTLLTATNPGFMSLNRSLNSNLSLKTDMVVVPLSQVVKALPFWISYRSQRNYRPLNLLYRTEKTIQRPNSSL